MQDMQDTQDPAASIEDLEFEARLEALKKEYEGVVPMDEKERKALEEAEAKIRDPDENFWNPQFWAMVIEDLKTVEWPSRKKAFQTFYISQIAFVSVILLVLFFDAFFESGIRTILLGEPFRITFDKILKSSGNNPM